MQVNARKTEYNSVNERQVNAVKMQREEVAKVEDFK